MKRRTFLKVLGAASSMATAASPVMRAFADGASVSDGHFFVFIHAAGGWDVTLSTDPRNEKKGIVSPASTENTDTAAIKHWTDAPLEGDERSFQLVQPAGSKIVFGPAIGDLLDLHDRLTVINGLAMNTVSHPDGTAFSATGRHLVGGRSPSASIDTMMANEFGREQVFPLVSVQFPSRYVGDDLDPRVVPLSVGSVGTIGRTLSRSELYDGEDEREAVTSLLSHEAEGTAKASNYPGAMEGMAVQLNSLRAMLEDKVQDVFSVGGLRKAQPDFDFGARFGAVAALNSAFAVEAMRRNVVRCVAFAQGGFDTHGNNYKNQAQLQQETFGAIATLVKTLDKTPHPTLAGKKLSDTTHILVVSDFCRTPPMLICGVRDHYPNNSALVISPRFNGNMVFGKSDVEQLLPAHAKRFADGERAIAPPDLLATLLQAMKVNPRKYMRDGEVVPELLRA